MSELAARWAISSKTPGRMQGYQIRCANEDGSVAGRLAMLADKMGTPQGQRDGERDALPWLTFTGGGTKALPMVAISSVAWTDDQDGTGQPISPTRMTWVPWSEIVHNGSDHTSLWQGLQRLRWPEVDGGPEGAAGHRVALTVPPPDRCAVVDEIVRHGLPFIALLAAHVVDGNRVAIVLGESDKVPVEARLRLLDAVLALLPFGARNCLTVATWASYRSAQDAVLTFSDGAQADQVEVLWRSRAAVHPPEGPGGRYLSELDRVLAEKHSIEAIVSHLATCTEPLDQLDDRAITALSEIRFTSVVVEEVRRGAGSVDRVRRALQQRKYSDGHLKVFARFLAERTGSVDRKEAKAARQIIVDEWNSTFSLVLGDLCRTGASEQGVDWLALSREAGTSSEFLRHALRLPVVEQAEPVLDALADLTMQYLTGTKDVPQSIYAALVAQPHVMIRFLSATLLIGSTNPLRRKAAEIKQRLSSDLNATLRELSRFSETTEPGWLRPILLAARKKAGSISSPDVEALAELGPTAMDCLVRLLVHKSGPRQSLDITWPGVVRLLAVHDASSTRDVVRTLLRVEPHRQDELSEDHRARVDVLCLLCGESPRYHDLGSGASDAFRRAVKELDHDAVATGVVTHVVRRFDSVSPAVVQRLENDLGIRIVQPYLDEVEEWLERGAVTEVIALDLPQQWLNDLKARPRLRWFRALHELRVVVTGPADVREVFSRAADALGNRVAAGEVLHLLASYVRHVNAVAVDDLLYRLYCAGQTSRDVAAELCGQLRDDPTHDFGSYARAKLDYYGWANQPQEQL